MNFVSRLELPQDVETHADEATIPEDVDGVQIRTIHSAKGLEFPIVVVPELGTQFNFGTDVDDDGKVLFDELPLGDNGRGEPVIGLKTPTPDDAFAEEQTLARRVVREHVRQHERAELKRLLYVAATRDHLLLSGIHEFEEADDGYRLADPRDPEEANCWRDWIQPALLEDEATPQQLAARDVVQRSLDENDYRIRRPQPPIDDWQSSGEHKTPSLTIDISSPPDHERVSVVTATDYASMRTGDHGPYLEDSDEGQEFESTDGLSATTLGTIVHRICETRLERSQWVRFARDVAQREGETPRSSDLDRVETYADRALASLDEYESSLDVASVHEELSVAPRFDGAHIVGDIDHLVVTPDAFHVADYKTNDLTDQSLDALADHYWPQLEVYAVALHQSDLGRNIELTLYFTDNAEPRTRRLVPDDLEDLERTIRSTVDGI